MQPIPLHLRAQNGITAFYLLRRSRGRQLEARCLPWELERREGRRLLPSIFECIRYEQ